MELGQHRRMATFEPVDATPAPAEHTDEWIEANSDSLEGVPADAEVETVDA